MEPFFFICGLLAFFYGIWALVSPFVVIGLFNRMSGLEEQLGKLVKAVKERERSASETPLQLAATAPEASVQATSPESPTMLRDLAAAKRETSTTTPILAAVRDTETTLPTPPIWPSHASSTLSEDTDEPKITEPAPVQITSPATVLSESSTPNTKHLTQPNKQPPTLSIPRNPEPDTRAPNRDEPSTFEEILAGKWLTWVGALAVIIGAGFGFKYAIENNYIGPRERVVIGILTGLTCFAGGAYAIRRMYVFLAQGLTGAGLGILYLSLYAAFGWYGIVSYEAAFVGMILTTTLGLSFAGYFNVQPTAVLGMLGGFLTPAMLWPDTDPLWTLFPYLLLLDAGVLLIAGVRRWAGLEILAFCGTLVIWLSWHREFYRPELIPQTTGFMTAFLVLFALLSVWHNVVRQRKALAGDFFLLLATPFIYFAALYSLTYSQWPHWQGDFALSMMLFYTVLAALAAVWHPAGKSVIAALAGVASTFLILSVPLELTGHWVTICWIAQAVLLVELGLYFRERTLAWTGLALLAKVQGILLIYFVGTLADPLHFQTAFVRIQLHLIGRPATPIDTATGLMSLVNGRSLSFLANILAFAILAWELTRKRRDPTQVPAVLPQLTAIQLWLNVTVPLAALVLVVLEIFAWGAVWNWEAATIVSGWLIWTSLIVVGLIAWGRRFNSLGIYSLGRLLFVLLGCLIAFETIEALQVALSGTLMPQHRLLAWWLINPRGIGVLSAITAMVVVALIYGSVPSRWPDQDPRDIDMSRHLMELFATCAYALTLGLVLLETRVWGAAHGWTAATIVAACSLATTGFLIGLLPWLMTKSRPWMEGVLHGTFLLLQFWFFANAMSALGTLTRPALPTFMSVFQWAWHDVRGLGLLVASLGCALAGWILSRNPAVMLRQAGRHWPLPYWLGIAAYSMGLATALLETGLWGIDHGWLASTLVSAWATGATVFLMGAVAWRVQRHAAWVDQIVLWTFLLVELFLFVSTLGTLQFVEVQGVGTWYQISDWWLLNPRGMGFVFAIVGSAIAASTLPTVPAKSDNNRVSSIWPLPQTLGIGAFVTGLILVLLETGVWGAPRGWLIGTLLSSSTAWISVFTVGLVAWSVQRETSDYAALIGILYSGLLVLLIALAIGGIDGFTNPVVPSSGTVRAFREPVELWLLNPRFAGFFVSILAAGLSGWLYRYQEKQLTLLPAERLGELPVTIDVSSLFGIVVFLTGVVMFTLEVYSQGISRDWQTATSLAVTLVWTTYATLTLLLGIYARSGWIRVFSLGLFVLTVGKVFLFDVWHLDTVIRVFAFISLGVALLLVSFLYRRFRDRIRSWISPGMITSSGAQGIA